MKDITCMNSGRKFQPITNHVCFLLELREGTQVAIGTQVVCYCFVPAREIESLNNIQGLWSLREI